MQLPVLGVGLTYFTGLEPLLETHGDLVDVLEVEPQTLWYQRAGGGYRVDRPLLDRIAALPGPKLMHGIGFPVGGTRPPDPEQVPPLLEMNAALRPPWMSEHLSFNAASTNGESYKAGFLLPPRQSPAGVEAAVASIRVMAEALPMPLAVETGVNYLRPRRDEMPDGAFTAAVVEGADCGLLLDLHNLWANEHNGRQPVEEFLAQIPLERVWEVHLAGGNELDDYWLDSHSGGMPEPLVALARQVIPRLPNLRAMIFELFPAYLEQVGLDLVREQLERLHELWDSRPRRDARARVAPVSVGSARQADMGPSPEEWEDTLGALAVGRAVESPLGESLTADPGIAVIRKLINDFRAGMVVRNLKLTSRLLMLSLGHESFKQLLLEYWQRETPRLFAADEAERFADFLDERDLEVPHLAEILSYERAVIATLLDGSERLVPFSVDPVPVLRALGDNRLPDMILPGDFEIRVTPRGESAEAQGEAAALQHLHT